MGVRRKSSLVPKFEKTWDSKAGRFVYLKRTCPYCTNGTIFVDGEGYECAACDGTGFLFRDGNPDVNEKLLAAAPSVYMDHVRKWSVSIAKV